MECVGNPRSHPWGLNEDMYGLDVAVCSIQGARTFEPLLLL